MDIEPRSSGGTPPHTSGSTYTFDYSTGMYKSLNTSSESQEALDNDVQERLECVALSLEDETPPVRSLLCPAHWGALLESTTVSLVSTVRDHGWDGEDTLTRPKRERATRTTAVGGSNLLERGVCGTPDSVSGNGDDSRTPQGGQSPQRYHHNLSVLVQIEYRTQVLIMMEYVSHWNLCHHHIKACSIINNLCYVNTHVCTRLCVSSDFISTGISFLM